MIIKSSSLVDYPLVSVVIPSYNRADTVGLTIESIMLQKCNFNFEIVIGDDFSTDNARFILKKYQKKYPRNIILIFHEQNIGLGANWATSVKHCRGKYIANCDNDDYWHNPNKLQLQVEFLETNLQYGVLHTDYRNHNRETGKIEEVIVSNLTFDIPLQKAIFTGKFKCCNATIMYRKVLIDKYVNLDDYIKFRFTLQDWNTWIILSKFTEFYCLPISTATFGIETESITRPGSYEKIEQRFNKEKKCYKYVCDLFPQNLKFDENGYDAYVFSILLNQAFKQKEFNKAHDFGKKIGNKSLKVLCSKYKLFFLIYSLFKINKS